MKKENNVITKGGGFEKRSLKKKQESGEKDMLSEYNDSQLKEAIRKYQDLCCNNSGASQN
jgi:hypothetical protein